MSITFILAENSAIAKKKKSVCSLAWLLFCYEMWTNVKKIAGCLTLKSCYQYGLFCFPDTSYNFDATCFTVRTECVNCTLIFHWDPL